MREQIEEIDYAEFIRRYAPYENPANPRPGNPDYEFFPNDESPDGHYWIEEQAMGEFCFILRLCEGLEEGQYVTRFRPAGIVNVVLPILCGDCERAIMDLPRDKQEECDGLCPDCCPGKDCHGRQ